MAQVIRSKRSQGAKQSLATTTAKKKADNTYKPQEQWTELTFDELCNDGLVYVHSSVKNFSRSLRSHFTDLKDSAEQTMPKYILNLLQQWKKEIKPTAEIRQSGILECFDKNGVNNPITVFDNIKKKLLEVIHSPQVQQALALDVERDAAQTIISYRVIGAVSSNQNSSRPFTKYIVKTPSVAAAHLIKYVDTAIFSDSQKNTFKEKLQFIINNKLQAGIEDNLADIIKEMRGINLKDAEVNVQDLFGELAAILRVLKRKVKKTQGNLTYSNTIQKLHALKNFNDLIENRYTIWKNAGFVYEDFNRIYNIQKNLSITNVGSGNSKINASDLEVLINGVQEHIGVTLKQQVNFKKTNVLNVNNTTGDPQEAEALRQALYPYKYFMLNYSLLSELEANQMSMNSSNGKWIDVKMSEVTEGQTLYNLFNNHLGRIFLVQSLLGNIIKHTKQTTSFKYKNLPIPYVLVTTDHAVFTYDILNELEQLLLDGAVEIQVPISPGIFSKHRSLITVKRKALEGGEIHGYKELLNDNAVSSALTALNKSAFKGGVNNININTTITMAKLMETLQNKAHNR